MGRAGWPTLLTCFWLVWGDVPAIGTKNEQATNTPAGHLQPLGSHRHSEGSIDTVEGLITPEIFYKDYVRASHPLLFKGAAKSLIAFKEWDDFYLGDKYGGLYVEAESVKKENRSQQVHLILFNEFLDVYQSTEIYMVHDVPPEMDEDVGVPKPLLCGGFQDILQTGVIWFSSGGTKSVLHADDVDNINCLLDGSKELIFIDKAFKADIEADGFVQEQGYSKVDVDAVDMFKFPHLQNVPWWTAYMEKGDCLYIPIGWYHQVYSHRGRNLAVNLWFQHLLWFNHSDCEEFAADLEFDFIPLSHYELPGPGTAEHIRSDMFRDFEFMESISMEDVVRVWGEALSNVQVHAIFQLLDMNKDLIISWDEVYSADVEMILKNFPDLLPGFFEEDEEVDDDIQGYDDEEDSYNDLHDEL